jgi:glyoxylase-like metal-dependent hydrolase (beta-lactamase superfamily II)
LNLSFFISNLTGTVVRNGALKNQKNIFTEKTMNFGAHRFKVGSIDCMAVSDGIFIYKPPTFPPPSKFLFSNATTDDLVKTLREHSIKPESWEEWVSSYICLMVDTGEHRVLIDTGANGLGPSTGKLLQNLQAEGIAREDIDTVILTHGHPDHIGGNIDNEGRLTFPNARYVMWKEEWDFWTSGQAEQKYDEHAKEVLLAVAQRNLPPLRERLYLMDQETEILPGISAIKAPGHTPGQIALIISSEDNTLLYLSDVFLHPIQVECPHWHSVIDLNPTQLEATRHKLLDRASSEKALVLAFHFPFPGLGYVSKKGDQWEWKPVETKN